MQERLIQVAGSLAVAALVNTTLRQLTLGMNAGDVVGVWKKIYDKQLASHGMGAGTCLAMSAGPVALMAKASANASPLNSRR